MSTRDKGRIQLGTPDAVVWIIHARFTPADDLDLVFECTQVFRMPTPWRGGAGGRTLK